MLYALFYLFGVAVVGGFGAGQINSVHQISAAQEDGKAQAVRGARVIRYWLDSSRPSGAPQGHAGVAG